MHVGRAVFRERVQKKRRTLLHDDATGLKKCNVFQTVLFLKKKEKKMFYSVRLMCVAVFFTVKNYIKRILIIHFSPVHTHDMVDSESSVDTYNTMETRNEKHFRTEKRADASHETTIV